ncbi:hypothetical protein EAO68_02165 [Streptomyces sp. wa22]|nr:hypothetical protein EAO68_02165 [Streptomyces sp. wa22]
MPLNFRWVGSALCKEEHWLGEAEGIDSTLTFLRAKQAEAARLAKRTVAKLGIPTSPSRFAGA